MITEVNRHPLSFCKQLSNFINVLPELRNSSKTTVTMDITYYRLFFTCVFPRSLSLHSHLFLGQADLLQFDHSVFGSHWQW